MGRTGFRGKRTGLCWGGTEWPYGSTWLYRGASNRIVAVLDDMIEEQDYIGVALDLLVVEVAHTMAVRDGQTAFSSLLGPAMHW